MASFEFPRGPESRVGLLTNGQARWAKDTGNLIIGGPDGNIQMAKQKDIDDHTLQLEESANDLKARSINIKYPFGTSLTPAKCDGVTDDTEAIRGIIQYAEQNGFGLFIPGVALISDELEFKKPIIVQGRGSSSNEGLLTSVVQISGFLMKRTVETNKRIRTRMNYRASSADAQDASLSVALNVQSENVTFRDFSVSLWFDKTDFSPTNYGSPCDVGIFLGCRTHFVQQNVHVLGYWREASWWVDVTHASSLPRFNDLNGVPYGNTVTAGGADGLTMIKCYARGGKWGMRVAGAKPKSGQAFDTSNGWYGNPYNPYYDELLGSTVDDRRGSYGFSDFTTLACTFFGTDHHSNYRRSAFGGNYLTDTAGGSMCVDGMAGNQFGRIQGHRHFSSRFSSFEPYRVKLERVHRVEFYGCHYESGGNTAYTPDGTPLTRTTADIYGHLTLSDLTDNVINLGSNTIVDKAYVAAGVRLQDLFSAHTSQYSTTTDTLEANILTSTAGLFKSTMDAFNIKRTVTGAEQYVMRTYSSGNIEFLGAGTVTMSGSPKPVTDNTITSGTASGRWSTVYAGTATINTSDEREKQQIGSVPNEWLDAWAEVNYTRFKFNDAVADKGESARWHVGVIAQSVEQAFKNHGLDAFEIGILCFDEWEDQYEEIDGEQVLITPAGNRYGIRADECQFLEMALMRRELQRLKSQ